MGGLREWTRDEIATRIVAGDTLVIYNKKLLRISPSWLAAHPGGELAILHFVGRDATDEIEAFHSEDTLKRMNGFAVGYVNIDEEGWQPFLPPVSSGWMRRLGTNGHLEWHQEAVAVRSDIDTEFSPSSQILLVPKNSLQNDTEICPTLETVTPPLTKMSLKIQAQHSAAYRVLHKRIVNAGLYRTPYLTGYGPEILRYILLAAASALAYSKGWYVPSAISLGLFWHQIAFTVHDLGHNGVTHKWMIDRLAAIFLASYLGGCSAGWWVDVRVLFHSVLLQYVIICTIIR